MSSFFPNPIFLQESKSMSRSQSRKLLLHTPLLPPPTPPPTPPSPLQPKDTNTFDANVVMVLSVLLCALICSLGLNSIIRCALRCSTFAAGAEPGNTTAARLANTGVKKKALKRFPTISYGNDLKLPGLNTECVICLSEFAPGDRVRVLPKCQHGFHVRCIDKWLNSHSSCPTCRYCLIETCNKIVGCSAAAAAAGASTAEAAVAAPPPDQEVVVRIEPLQHEGLIRNHLQN
ncbi:RING-H2 finger protein ATL78-like [Andrographis paniculata]|uniref:RING-H2 finger protein ATL78-like n=1 Tax=Andrographis paniculata TaxID=175694 RepID=UPI0021E72BC2|nr:RING-H2 finger protein ATL78-like [Andrographis paniculata]